MIDQPQLTDIFRALADINRLTLFDLLMYSDQTNSELMNATGLSQNLLSHHLSVMADCHLIDVHQSIGDARRRYYSPNLDTTRAMCDWWQTFSPSLTQPLAILARPRTVLFLCSTNSIRSLMAEAIATHLASESLRVRSAGMVPGVPIPPVLFQVLEEHGIPGESLQMRMYSDLDDHDFEFVITACDRVHESELPDSLSGAEVIHWSLRDPMQESFEPAEQLALARELYRAIHLRLVFFVQRLADRERTP